MPGFGSGTGRTGASARCFSPTSSARRPGGFTAGWSCRCGPSPPADAIRAVQITSRYPRVHGAPIHLGLPERIGIEDVGRAWQGDDPIIAPGELPVFWACGVTPQVAVRSARPPIAITHTPAHMLVTDVRNASLAVG